MKPKPYKFPMQSNPMKSSKEEDLDDFEILEGTTLPMSEIQNFEGNNMSVPRLDLQEVGMSMP